MVDLIIHVRVFVVFFLGDGVCNVIGFGKKCVWWL